MLQTIADGSTTYAEYLLQNSPQIDWGVSTAMQTDQCQDPTGDKPPTTEADLDTQTGKEESCALKEKNTKLAYSVNRGSQEWTCIHNL